jgi:hypothetical protein
MFVIFSKQFYVLKISVVFSFLCQFFVVAQNEISHVDLTKLVAPPIPQEDPSFEREWNMYQFQSKEKFDKTTDSTWKRFHFDNITNQGIQKDVQRCPSNTVPHPKESGECLVRMGVPTVCPKFSILHNNVCREILSVSGTPVCPENSTFLESGICFFPYNTSCLNTNISSTNFFTSNLEDKNCEESIKNVSLLYCENGHLASDGNECIEEFVPSIRQCPKHFVFSSPAECIRYTYTEPVDECKPGSKLSKNGVCEQVINSEIPCPENYVYDSLLKKCSFQNSSLSTHSLLMAKTEKIKSAFSSGNICINITQQAKKALTDKDVQSLTCPEGYSKDTKDLSICFTYPITKRCPQNTIFSPLSELESFPCLFTQFFGKQCPEGYTFKNDNCLMSHYAKPSCPQQVNCYKETYAFFSCPPGSVEMKTFSNVTSCITTCQNLDETVECEPNIIVEPIPNCPNGFTYDGDQRCFRVNSDACPNGEFDRNTRLCRLDTELRKVPFCSQDTKLVEQMCTQVYRTHLEPICPLHSHYNWITQRCEMNVLDYVADDVACPENSTLYPDKNSCFQTKVIPCPSNITFDDNLTKTSLLSGIQQSKANSNHSNSELLLKTPSSIILRYSWLTQKEKDLLQKTQPLLVSKIKRCPPKSNLLHDHCVVKETVTPIFLCLDPSTTYSSVTSTCIRKSSPKVYYKRGVLLKPMYRCPDNTFTTNKSCLLLSKTFTLPMCSQHQELFRDNQGNDFCFQKLSLKIVS